MEDFFRSVSHGIKCLNCRVYLATTQHDYQTRSVLTIHVIEKPPIRQFPVLSIYQEEVKIVRHY